MPSSEEYDDFSSVSCDNLIEIADALMETERDELAFKILFHLADRDPKNASTWCRIGYLHQGRSEYNAAEKAYKRATAADTTSVEGWVGLCMLYLEIDDQSQAQQIFNKKLRDKKAFKEMWQAAGTTVEDLDTRIEVEFATYCVVAFEPRNVPALLCFGNLLLWKHERFSKALVTYENVTKIDPGFLQGWLGLGTAHGMIGNMQAAKAVFLQALEISPSSHRVWHLLGSTLGDLEEYDEAEKALKKALELSPKDTHIMMTLANLFDRMGQEEKADKIRHKGLIEMLKKL